jgi:hypothetical protein
MVSSITSLQAAMGMLGVLITLAAYVVMVLGIKYYGKRPNPVTWFGFGALTAVGYFVQWQKGAAAGSWVMGVTFIACFIVTGASWATGHWKLKDFDRWDWTAFAIGMLCGVFYIVSWKFSFGPLVAAVWATAGDLILYKPTFRSGRSNPNNEISAGYFLNSVKFIPTFLAMPIWANLHMDWSSAELVVDNCLYSAALVVMNGYVVYFLYRRRRVLGLKTEPSFRDLLNRLLQLVRPAQVA